MKGVSSILVAVAMLAFSAHAEPNYDVSNSAAGYKINGGVKHTKTGLEIPLAFNSRKSSGKNLFGNTVDDLVVTVDYETADRLHVKIADKDRKQYTVPDSELGLVRPNIKHAAHNPNYEFKYTNRPFGFQVIRKSDKAKLFDTTDFPLVFEDQYLEVSTALPEDASIYGLGETVAPFLRHRNVTTLWARDAATPFYENQYGSHPYYTEIRNGKAHGTFLLNSHGMDIFLTGDGRLTYKVIGGVLDFYFFVPKDNTPNGVLSSYTDLIGKPFMPALWMLGWHQCRWGYKNLDHVQRVIDGYKDADIPLETVWIDIDYMDRLKDFTFDPVNFPKDRMVALGKQLHRNKQRFVTMVDPAISTNTNYSTYTRGQELDIFLKNSDGSEFVGQVWPGYTAFPDWWHPNVTEFWGKEMSDFINLLDLDGVWIDMNEPSSFCTGSCGDGKRDENPAVPWALSDEEAATLRKGWLKELDARGTSVPGDKRNLLYPKYSINNGAGYLSEKTAPTTALHHGGVPHYDIHNLYGHAEGYVSREVMLKNRPDERVFLLTRSSFAGSGRNMGHWTGDNHSLWSYLKNSITEIFNLNMFGISYVGADVCGFNGNTTETLCTRWSELGAFYPFARNHNAANQTDQEPYLWKSTTEASRIALAIRYSLLPYYYTLFEESHRVGTGVWRPLVFEYPEDKYLTNDYQVLVGKDLLISPVVTENATKVDAQFPKGLWYDWYDYESVIHGETEKTLDAPLTHIPLHIRGGAILPLKTPKYSVQETYETPYSLLIALDENSQAEGRLYIDDGHSLKQEATSDISFSFKDGKLQAKGTFGYKAAEKLEIIKVIGKEFSKATYNGHKLDVSKKDGALVLSDVGIELTGAFNIQFA
ncbi:alpha glucosidase [Syncephalastrum racemosum]|uniref:alpha-glucosidase n=1 Tax=Syncephalastrum racemosum TaxID=13706 RepID=A0A1X2H4W6_SYNRA|nr:alpha glucosidase [Syncephalastrum racemosum]